MAEIKSTLELAMEKTKKMAISEKEREEIKRKETEQKVNSLSYRYIEGHLLFNELLKELEKMDQKTLIGAQETLLSQWIAALSLKDEDERLFKGIARLKRCSIDELKQKYHQMLAQYRREKETIQEEIRAQLTETLRAEGIYGSALEPNIERSPLWEKRRGDLDQLYSNRLEEIKERLRTL